MTLRGLVAALLLANAGVLLWTQGWLDPLLGAPASREPDRMARQIDAQSIRVVAPGERTAAPPSNAAPAALALPAPAPASAPRPACLEAGPFADGQLAAAEQLLLGLPPASWVRVTDARPGRYAIVMGRFGTDEARLKKEEELGRLRLPFEPLASPPAPAALAGALSLGQFDGREAAQAALASLTARGVQTARIEPLAPPGVAHRLRVAQAEPALAAQLAALDPAALAGGFRPCETASR